MKVMSKLLISTIGTCKVIARLLKVKIMHTNTSMQKIADQVRKITSSNLI